ncbi:hypothetical protein FB451DRAFT_1554764 [Mycena latifolia]|nr:hypothetical protein FB451DRAFT_1554764 [Mycena latifolia]
MPVLNLDVLTAVIEQLDDEDTIKVFSLAGRAMLLPSQRRLFSTLTVYSEFSENPATFARARTLLQESPHIATYIQDLIVDMPALPKEDATPLVFLLETVQNVRRFKMMPRRSVSWNTMPVVLTAAILAITSRPSIDELYFAGFHSVPLTFLFRAFTSFRTLSIIIAEQDRFGTTEIEELFASSFNSHLEELCFDTPSPLAGSTVHPIFDFIHRSQCLKLLKRLQISLNHGDTNYESKLLTSVASTLQHLEINLRENLAPLDLPCFEVLRSFQLNFAINDSEDGPRSLPDFLSSFIEHLPAVMPTLESMAFTVGIHHDEFRLDTLDLPWFAEEPYPLFTHTHQYRASLPALREVHFKLHVQNIFLEDTPPAKEAIALKHFRDAINFRFPSLSSTNMLSFSIHDDSAEREFLGNVELEVDIR